MYNLEELINDEADFRKLADSMDSGKPHGLLRCAKIKLTPRCNLRCSMCKFWRSRPEDELTTSEIERILEGLRKQGALKIHFSGGEIFLRDDLIDIISCARSLDMKVNLTTNGTLVTKSLARRLIRLKTNSISFSLDGDTAKMHDSIRGVKGAFRRIFQGMEYVRDARNEHGGRTKIRINVVLQKKNFRSIPEIVDLGGKAGATEVKIIPVDGKGSKRSILSKKEILEFNREIVPRVTEIRTRYGFSTEKHMIYPFGREKEQINWAKGANYSLGYYREHPCFAPWLHTFIAWDGNVYPCCNSRARIEPLGNARSSKLEEIFEGPSYRSVRKRFLTERYAFCDRCDDFLSENRLLGKHLAFMKDRQ